MPIINANYLRPTFMKFPYQQIYYLLHWRFFPYVPFICVICFKECSAKTKGQMTICRCNSLNVSFYCLFFSSCFVSPSFGDIEILSAHLFDNSYLHEVRRPIITIGFTVYIVFEQESIKYDVRESHNPGLHQQLCMTYSA